MQFDYTSTPGVPLRSPEEALEAIRRNKAEAARRAKRRQATRRRNERALDRMIAEAVARDTR